MIEISHKYNTYDLRNQLIRTVTADSANLLMRAVGVDTFYYMYNAHADVTALVTPDGRIAATYDYDPFGNVIEKTGDANNNILFAGYQYDPETGMYYLNSRMYDPITARFLQEDTYTGVGSDPLSLNLYTYCYNSPLKYYDPTGHSPEYGAGGGMYGMPASVYDGYYKYKKTADSFKSKARGQQYMKAYNLAQTLDDDSKATILQGLDLMDSEDGKFYDYGIQSAASELIATDKSKLNSESISKLALKKQFSVYMDSLKVDPSTAEPNVGNYLFGVGVGLIDAGAQMVRGVYDSAVLAGQGVGNYAWSNTSDLIAYGSALSGQSSWTDFNSTFSQNSKIRESIALGVPSGVLDFAIGSTVGAVGSLSKTIYNNDSANIFAAQMINNKDQYAINTYDLDEKYYNQGKGGGQTLAFVGLLAIGLDSSLKAGKARANSTPLAETPIADPVRMGYSGDAFATPEAVTAFAEARAAQAAASQVVSEGTTGINSTNSIINEASKLGNDYVLNPDRYVNHIIEEHGPNSSYLNKSRFNPEYNIMNGIDSTLTGSNSILKPNTNGRSGYIFEQTYSEPIGTSAKGKPCYTMKVVIDETGEVITAYPKK